MISVEAWRAAYDDMDSVIYLLDADRRIVRCNRAWDRFALANAGGDALSTKVIGTDIMCVIPSHLRNFYSVAYDNVQRHRRDWWHTFECSSPTQARVFHMRILAGDPCGWLTINTLISSTDLKLPEPHEMDDYADLGGVAIMCSHCRRVRRRRDPLTWDWVPELLIAGKMLVSFGLCEFCTAYHYHFR